MKGIFETSKKDNKTIPIKRFVDSNMFCKNTNFVFPKTIARELIKTPYAVVGIPINLFDCSVETLKIARRKADKAAISNEQ